MFIKTTPQQKRRIKHILSDFLLSLCAIIIVFISYYFCYRKVYSSGFKSGLDTATVYATKDYNRMHKSIDSIGISIKTDLFRLRSDSARMNDILIKNGLPKYKTLRADSIRREIYFKIPDDKKPITFKKIFKIDTSDGRYKHMLQLNKYTDSMNRINRSNNPKK